VPKFEGVQTDWPIFSDFTNDGKINGPSSQWLSELVGRLNNALVLEFAGNPEGNVTGIINQLCRDTTGGPPVLYIKTTDGGNTGWVAV
jgi:hypothetical protein